jgi:hypothetical protein
MKIASVMSWPVSFDVFVHFTAAAKIGIAGNACYICLEENGTEVDDDDDILAEMKEKTHDKD